MSHDAYLLPAPDHAALRGHLEALMRAQVHAAQAQRETRRAGEAATDALCLDMLEIADMLASQVSFLEAQPAEGPWPRLARNLARTRNKLLGSLGRRGLVIVPIAVGEPPDYRVCVAVERREVDGGAGELVAAVLRDGYLIADRVLRPAEVAIQVPGHRPPAEA